jgi:hypothetical protein
VRGGDILTASRIVLADVIFFFLIIKIDEKIEMLRIASLGDFLAGHSTVQKCSAVLHLHGNLLKV